MKNTIGKILYISLNLILLLLPFSFIFIEKSYMNLEYGLTLVYFHAFILLFIGIFIMFFTSILINIRLPNIDFSNKQSIKSFLITIFFIFITYFVIGEYLWSFLLSGLTEINIIKTNNPELLTRMIPTIGAGLIFFYKFFGYMQNVNFDYIKINYKNALPFISSDIGEFNFIKEILRDLIIGSVFLAFLILGINGKTIIVQYSYLYYDAILSALIVSLFFTFLEVYVWIVTTQYKENLVNYATEANLNHQNKKHSRESNIKYRDNFIENLKKSKTLKQIYSFIDKKKHIIYLLMILILILLSYFAIKSIDMGEEYVTIRANIVNVSISENSTDKIYYSEIVYPNEKQFSFQLGKISSINNTHVLKKIDEDRADAKLQKIEKNGYLNIDIKDTFSCMKMRINKNKIKNLTFYIVPQEKTKLLFSPIDGDVFLFLSGKLKITQFYEISITDYSMNGEDIYIHKLNVFNETGNTSFIGFYEHYNVYPVEDVVTIFMNNKTLANELKEFISENNPDYTYLIINETDVDLERIYGKCYT